MKNCTQCGKVLEGQHQLKFCSISCSTSHSNTLNPRRTSKWKHDCPECGTSTNNKKYCSRTCWKKAHGKGVTENTVRARRLEAHFRWRARRKNQMPKNENIQKLKEFYENCPKGHEVDHIIPLSKGGLHSLSNLQYLTISENRRKSNKINWR